MTGSSIPEEAVAELCSVLGDRVLLDPDVMLAHTRDQCHLTPAGTPLAVVRATSTSDVVATMQWATASGAAVVVRGAGTGLAGGANAIDGGVVLDLARMDAILDIDPVARTARVQAGVVNGVLDAAARKVGLRYVPDPGSKDISTIGGNIATNAGGLCCVKHGVTADHVDSLVAVLADGRVIRPGRSTRKDVAGLDLVRLLTGSEGTLAVLVEATVRLLPLAPVTATAALTFSSLADAVATVRSLEMTPSVAELMDATTVQCVNDATGMGLDQDSAALVLVQCDGPSATSDIAHVLEAARACGALEVHATDDAAEGAAFMAARRAALPALERKGSVLLDDVSVPLHQLPTLVERIIALSARLGVCIGTFGHLADGNLHPTIVFDAHDPDACVRAEQAFAEILDLTLALDGSITGEHGVGTLKLAHLDRQIGFTELTLMREIKRVFDPANLLNPGKGY